MKKKYYINENIITEEGRELPRGFSITIDKDITRLEVYSDIYDDTELLYEENLELSYEEEIPLTKGNFKVKYENGNPVNINDGDLLGISIHDIANGFVEGVIYDGTPTLLDWCLEEVLRSAGFPQTQENISLLESIIIEDDRLDVWHPGTYDVEGQIRTLHDGPVVTPKGRYYAPFAEAEVEEEEEVE